MPQTWSNVGRVPDSVQPTSTPPVNGGPITPPDTARTWRGRWLAGGASDKLASAAAKPLAAGFSAARARSGASPGTACTDEETHREYVLQPQTPTPPRM